MDRARGQCVGTESKILQGLTGRDLRGVPARPRDLD